jgi:hypothetical protein
VVERDTFRNDLVVVRDRFPTDALCWTCVSRSAATESPRRRPQPIMTQPWRRVLDPQHGAAARVVGLTPPVVIAVLLIMIGWWLDSASSGPVRLPLIAGSSVHCSPSLTRNQRREQLRKLGLKGQIGGATTNGPRNGASVADNPAAAVGPHERGLDQGSRCRAGDENRTRMTSLEGIRAPTRADSDAPVGLTCLRREAPSLTLV